MQTERLTLKPHTLDDGPDSAALWADAEVVRFIGGVPSTPGEAWARLHRYAGHWAMLGYGYWVVRERGTGRFIGEVGFGDYRRGLGPGFDGAPEAGWALTPLAHGNGYATEAVTAALAWADEHLPGRRTVCLIDPENPASLAVAAKVGFREFARAIYKDSPVILFERR